MFSALRARWARKTPRLNDTKFDRLLAELDRLDALEDRLDIRLRGPASAAEPLPIVVEPILACREAKVRVLHDLGWHQIADQLAEDCKMRRTWIAEGMLRSDPCSGREI